MRPPSRRLSDAESRRERGGVATSTTQIGRLLRGEVDEGAKFETLRGIAAGFHVPLTDVIAAVREPGKVTENHGVKGVLLVEGSVGFGPAVGDGAQRNAVAEQSRRTEPASRARSSYSARRIAAGLLRTSIRAGMAASATGMANASAAITRIAHAGM